MFNRIKDLWYGISVKNEPNSDSFRVVWLFLPTWIYEEQEAPVYPHKNTYLEKSYVAWWCWALKRKGTYIGVKHEPITKLGLLVDIGVVRL